MSIQAFIARCDRFCEATNLSQAWLSKRLLLDSKRLRKLAAGEVDIGVKRMERAMADLKELERNTVRPRKRKASPALVGAGDGGGMA